MKRFLKKLSPIRLPRIYHVDVSKIPEGCSISDFVKGRVNWLPYNATEATDECHIFFFGFNIGFCQPAKDQGFFRLNNGWGMKWKDLTKHELIFSERNGYTKGYRLCKWYFRFLSKNDLPKS